MSQALRELTIRIAAVLLGLGVAAGSLTAAEEMTLTDSVGKGGKNKCSDVRVVQYLLNQIPAAQGGTAGALIAVDGKSGPTTEKSILHFQRKNAGLAQDSKVDKDGATLKKLNALNPNGAFKPGRSAKVKADGTPAAGPHPGQVIAWGNVVTAEFKAKVLTIAADLEMDPSHLMAVMNFESGNTFAPDVQNPDSCAAGLIQFTSPTAVGLGTTTFDLLKMSAEDQLDFVKKHLQPKKGKMKKLSDAYMAVLNPSMVGKPDETAVFTKVANPTEYEQNKGLDKDMNGTITKEEAAGKVQDRLDEGLKASNKG